ncbi:MAG: MmpS family transport accessory protein [Mycobacterium sp.]|nr:MmpS family transport accessory protein [Mycobacterium sp.]
MFKVLKKLWIPLVIVVVVAVASFLVVRIRGYFGHDFNSGTTYAAADDVKPFNPKVVTYEIFGVPGATADINYLDLDAKPQRVDGATLPWSLTLSTTAPGVMPNIVAQGDGDTISCRITVDDEVKDENSTTGVNAQTFCLVKNA